MKYLINKTNNYLQGVRKEPLDFSISGLYAIDIEDKLPIKLPDIPIVTSAILESNKIDAYHRLLPHLPNHLVGEYNTTIAGIDSAQSNGVSIGTQKTIVIYPGGTLLTNTLAFSSTSLVYSHWYGFLLGIRYSDYINPRPNEILYGYNENTSLFEEFNPTNFLVEIRDSANTMTLLALNPDQEMSFVFGGPSIRIRITNNSLLPYHLSDWILLSN